MYQTIQAGMEPAGRPSKPAAFSLAMLHAISKGDHSCEASLLHAFSLGVPSLLGQMVRAFADRDAERIRRAAHALRGECLMLGAKPLADVCSALESAATRGDLARVAAGLDQACEAWRTARPEVDGYIEAIADAAPAIDRG